MNSMANVTFGGIAPIPSGTRVRLLVDNPANPTKAISVEDTDHKVFYSSATPSRATKATILDANYVTATVDSTIVNVKTSQTTLSLSNLSAV